MSEESFPVAETKAKRRQLARRHHCFADVDRNGHLSAGCDWSDLVFVGRFGL